ncbi:hypothetical protein PENTCL1PPCAC_15537, partial [Pristionchus entomophagus]
LQASILYLMTIFSLQHWMSRRAPFKLQLPMAAWNFSIALVSGVCVATMTPEFVDSVFNKGFGASLCSTRESVYSGNNGRALFVLLIARLPEFIDTLFIVLRKQPLIFLHYYHHAVTLCTAWFTYSSFSPGLRHAIYVNSIIHTVMYSYFIVTTLKFRPPPIVARCITIGQIAQFAYLFYVTSHMTVIQKVLGEPCQSDDFGLGLTWAINISYLYLFVDFYLNKYS